MPFSEENSVSCVAIKVCVRSHTDSERRLLTPKAEVQSLGRQAGDGLPLVALGDIGYRFVTSEKSPGVHAGTGIPIQKDFRAFNAKCGSTCSIDIQPLIGNRILPFATNASAVARRSLISWQSKQISRHRMLREALRRKCGSVKGRPQGRIS